MNIAIDLDGTLSRYPDKLRGIIACSHVWRLRIILTAAAGELPPLKRPAEVTGRLINLNIYIGRDYDQLACVESRDKGQWCHDHQVDIIIDDSPDVLADVKLKSPNTVRLLVT